MNPNSFANGSSRRGSIARVISLAAFAAVAILMSAPRCDAQFSGGGVSSASAFSIPQAQLIQPNVLSQKLQGAAKGRPMVLQVGSYVMFGQAHIAGSLYAGPGSQPSGLQLLESRVTSSPKSRFIVLYCGCCPWNHCPNVGPAYQRLHDLGFTNVKVLYLASNFGDDWVDKGYRVEQGD